MPARSSSRLPPLAAIKARDDIEEVIVHTGQHFDANMSDVFFDQLDIPRPHHNLQMAGLSHGAMTGRMLEGIEMLVDTAVELLQELWEEDGR